jgi:D-amino peptidase
MTVGIMKIYIITDLEGVAGVVLRDQQLKGHKEYDEACSLLTKEVNAAVEGILSVGEAEIYVNDGHGGGFNFVLEELDEEAKFVLGSSRPFTVGGLDESFDAVFLLGYHSMAGSKKGVLSHTMNSRDIYRVIFNGAEIGEIGIEALLAGYYNVPVALVTGDAAAVSEAKKILGDVETVTVKWGLGRLYAICISPKKARVLIREAAAETTMMIDKYKPFKVNPPYEVVVEYLTAENADVRSKRRGVERINERTLRIKSNDLKDALAQAGMC